MKRLLYLLLFLLMVSCSIRPNWKVNLEAARSNYLNALLSCDFDQALKYLPDTVFTVISRDDFRKALQDATETEGTKFNFVSLDATIMGAPERMAGITYVQMTQSGVSNIVCTQRSDQTYEEFVDSYDQLVATMSALPDTEVRQQKDFTLRVTNTVVMYGISENGVSDWRFITLEEENRFLMEPFLPSEIIDRHF